jgi:Zn-dependent protease
MTDTGPATKGISLGRLLGARVILQPSTIIMVGLLAWVFASGAGPVTGRTLALGAMLAVLLFASVFLHEFAHAVAARAYKREVKEIVITLWGGHTSFDAADMKPSVHAITAAAGPAMNLVIALVAQGVTMTGLLSGWSAAVVAWLGWANVFLAVFNFLPGIPMDGGKVLEAIVWAATGNRHRATVVAAWGGRVVAVGVVLYVLVEAFARGTRPSFVNLIWAFLIASILWPAASAALKYSQAMGKREGLTVSSLMKRAVGVPYDITVERARDDAAVASAQEVVVLAADGAPAGHFPVALTNEVPADARGTTSLQAVTMPLPRGAHVPVTLAGEDLVRALREWWGKTDVWVVLDGDKVVGVAPLNAVLDALK